MKKTAIAFMNQDGLDKGQSQRNNPWYGIERIWQCADLICLSLRDTTPLVGGDLECAYLEAQSQFEQLLRESIDKKDIVLHYHLVQQLFNDMQRSHLFDLYPPSDKYGIIPTLLNVCDEPVILIFQLRDCPYDDDSQFMRSRNYAVVTTKQAADHFAHTYYQ